LRFVGKLPARAGTSLEQPTAKRLGVATIALALLIAWLPLQTPLAMIVFQYGHAETLARAMLLLKDAFTVLLIAYFFVRYWRRLQFYWFDWAAVVYVALLGVYSIVPWVLGSHISFLSVAASARELAVPVELYALGRLALAAGADVRWLVRWFLAVAAAAAAFTVFEMFFLPTKFWSSTMDLVTFTRVVQGVSNVHTIWDLSIVAQMGAGPNAAFHRAVGPFTHPVGTGHYFVLPLVLSVASFYQSLNQGRRREAAAMVALILLFAGAVIAPISRGSWMAVGLAVLICSLIYRRRAIVVIGLVVAATVVLTVPPLRYSIVSVLNGTDSSSKDHANALDKGITTVIQNPLGLGVGESDQFGQVLASGDSAGAGVGENMYITLLVSVGPLGFLAFLAWMVGLLKCLLAVRRRAPPPWMVIGSAAAMVGYLVAALLASPLMRFTTSASVWLVIGLVTGVVLAAPDAPSHRENAAGEGAASAPAT
jgi:xanthosine utilization system XapX-like protein